jgi:hypothetical protein
MQWHCNPPLKDRRAYGQKLKALFKKMITALEKRKLDILDREYACEEDDDLLFLKSLLLHIKYLPHTRKLCLHSTFQDLLIHELEQVENSSRLSSAYSTDVSNLNHQPEDLPCHEWNNYKSSI